MATNNQEYVELEREREINGEVKASILPSLIPLILLSLLLVMIFQFKPYENSFRMDDYSIQHDIKPEIISYLYLLISALVVPPVVITLKEYNLKLITNYLMGFGTTVYITEFLKISVGRLRPDFIARCIPDLNMNCLGEVKNVVYARKSFPSGHSSTAFYMGWYLILLLFKKNCLYTMLLLLLIFQASCFVASSRVIQNVHHPSDVVSGSILGISISILFYLTGIK